MNLIIDFLPPAVYAKIATMLAHTCAGGVYMSSLMTPQLVPFLGLFMPAFFQQNTLVEILHYEKDGNNKLTNVTNLHITTQKIFQVKDYSGLTSSDPRISKPLTSAVLEQPQSYPSPEQSSTSSSPFTCKTSFLASTEWPRARSSS